MKQLTDLEKNLILGCHAYFLRISKELSTAQPSNVRQRVAECLGYGMATVARVIAAKNKRQRETEEDDTDDTPDLEL